MTFYLLFFKITNAFLCRFKKKMSKGMIFYQVSKGIFHKKQPYKINFI